MTEPRKRTPAETWRALEQRTAEPESGADDEMERILGLSDDDLDRELVAEGLDPKAVRARGESIARGVRAAAGASPVTPLAPARSRRSLVWLLAAALGAVLVVVAIVRSGDDGPAAAPNLGGADPSNAREGRAADAGAAATDASARQDR